ncbi:MAG: hypothetical protein WCB18_05305 [Thermoplasmata archaeon]
MESRDLARFGAWDWFRRFCELYDSSASSMLTELGLFYDRHRKFSEYGQRSDPGDSQYTDEEWKRVMATMLGELAGNLGLVQAPDWEVRSQLEWFLPGVADKPMVVIRETPDATSAILTRDLAELAGLGSELTVFLMYPDYPLPAGVSTYEGAIRAWRELIEHRLAEILPKREMLALMISAYSFDLPAPWQGFVWNPSTRSLEAAR